MKLASWSTDLRMATALDRVLSRQSSADCRREVLLICLGRLLGVSASCVLHWKGIAYGSAINRSVSFTIRFGSAAGAAML